MENNEEPVHHAINDELTTCGLIWDVNDDNGYSYTYGKTLVTCEDCIKIINPN